MFYYCLYVAVVGFATNRGGETVKGSEKILNKNCKGTTGAGTTTVIAYLSGITVSLTHFLTRSALVTWQLCSRQRAECKPKTLLVPVHLSLSLSVIVFTTCLFPLSEET